MSDSSSATEGWRSRAQVESWVSNDDLADLLEFPRAIASSFVLQDRPDARLVLEFGCGTGGFTARFLDDFPAIRAVCTDVSAPMLEHARRELAPYDDRVTCRIADMSAPRHTELPYNVDVVITARASHHLSLPELVHFYCDAFERLTPGGWLINLDHMGQGDWWDRFSAARAKFKKPGAEHPHDHPLPTLPEHFSALNQAGFTDICQAWQAFFTGLLLARKGGQAR